MGRIRNIPDLYMSKKTIAMVHTTIRGDEKLLMDAAKPRNISLSVVDMREQLLSPYSWRKRYGVVLERCVSTTIGTHAISFFEALGTPVVNNSHTAGICVDKFVTSLVLKKAKVPTVAFAMAFDEPQALRAVSELGGYPVVIKPASGSWGRLLAKINDRDSLEAIIEQKMVLGSPSHKALYIQKFVDKPGRDIRVTVVGGNVVCAIYRGSEHWITNTARGAEAKPCPVDRDLKKISLAASNAVGGGVLGIDVFETDEGYVINEINHTVEFKNVQRVTGVDVAGAILEYCQGVSL